MYRANLALMDMNAQYAKLWPKRAIVDRKLFISGRRKQHYARLHYEYTLECGHVVFGRHNKPVQSSTRPCRQCFETTHGTKTAARKWNRMLRVAYKKFKREARQETQEHKLAVLHILRGVIWQKLQARPNYEQRK